MRYVSTQQGECGHVEETWIALLYFGAIRSTPNRRAHMKAALVSPDPAWAQGALQSNLGANPTADGRKPALSAGL